MNQFPQGELFHSQQRFLAHEHEVVQAINWKDKKEHRLGQWLKSKGVKGTYREIEGEIERQRKSKES